MNWITFVWKYSFSMTLTSFFFFWNYLRQHQNIPLYFLGELYHHIPLLFCMSSIYLVVWFIGKCFTNCGRRKSELYLFIDDFLDGTLVAGDLVHLSNIGTFLIPFSIYYIVSQTLDGLRRSTSFYTLIFSLWRSFFSEVTNHVSTPCWPSLIRIPRTSILLPQKWQFWRTNIYSWWKMFRYIDVECWLMSIVVSLGVSGLVAFLVTAHKTNGSVA